VCKVTCTQAFCPLKLILHFYRAACPCLLSFCQFSPPAIIKSNQHQAPQPASNQPPSIAKRQSFVSRAELLFFQGHSTIFFFLPNISLFAFLHPIVKQNSTVKHPQKKNAMSTNATETVAAAAPDIIETIVDSLNDATLAPKTEISEADAAHAASAAEGRRLYIGNLNYITTEEQLKEFFEGFSMWVSPFLSWDALLYEHCFWHLRRSFELD